MSDYYYVFFRDDEPADEPTGVAYAPREVTDVSIMVEDLPPEMELPVLTLRDGGFSDYLGNNLGGGCLSARRDSASFSKKDLTPPTTFDGSP